MSKLIEALDCKATKPKVLGAYNTLENVWGDLLNVDHKVEKEKPHGNRKRDKEKLEVTKECGECGKTIKNAKKALMCKCKVILFCTHTCLGSSDHFTGCGGRDPPVKIKPNQMLRLGDAITEVQNKHLRRTKSKLSELNSVHPDEILKMAERGHPVAAWMIGCSYSLRATTLGVKGLDGADLGIMMPVKGLKRSEGETDEEAIKWFLIAANGGMSEQPSCGQITDSKWTLEWPSTGWPRPGRQARRSRMSGTILRRRVP